MFEKNLAPNDPKRIPPAHRELVNKMFLMLQEQKYNLFEAQIVTQALSVLRNVKSEKFLSTAYMIGEMAKVISEVKDGPQYLEAILQILGMKMTESLNEMSLETIGFKKF